MKALGRILMAVTGIGLIVFGGFYMTQLIQMINGFQWEGLSNFVEKLPNYLSGLKAVFLILFGLSALFSAIRGKASFRYFIYSALLVGFSVWSFIASKNEGEFVLNANSISLIVLPAVYLFSSLILFIARLRGK